MALTKPIRTHGNDTDSPPVKVVPISGASPPGSGPMPAPATAPQPLPPVDQPPFSIRNVRPWRLLLVVVVLVAVAALAYVARQYFAKAHSQDATDAVSGLGESPTTLPLLVGGRACPRQFSEIGLCK